MVPGDFTLEKLKVAERLAALEKTIDILIERLEQQREYDLEGMKAMKDNIEKLNKIVIGNGTPGLVGKVDSLEKARAHIIALYTVSLGVILKFLFDSVHK